MNINSKQLAAVIALPDNKRYEHFIKVIVDSEEVWGLYKDGWALAATDDDVQVFPVWPAKEYAHICAKDEWSGYQPRSFSLSDFMDELLPKLRFDCVLPCVFLTPEDKGVTPLVSDLEDAIKAELLKY